MKRPTLGALAGLALAGAVATAAASTDEQGYVVVPDEAIKTMDLGRAMDVVTAYRGHYWLRSLRSSCPYVTASGERGVDNFGVRLENFIGMHLGEVESWPATGVVLFDYPQVAGNVCRIPARVASEQDAVELAAAFLRLAREPEAPRRQAIAARYALDVAGSSSIRRFLETEASIDIARLLLEDAVRALVQPGGAGEFVAGPRPLPAGSEYRGTTDYLSASGEPDRQDAWSFRVLAAGADGYEVQRVRGDRVEDCSDRDLFRAITHDAPRNCRGGNGAAWTNTLQVEDGQASYLPATINTAAVYEAEVEGRVALSSGREFTRHSREIRACYAEAIETIAVPAGTFDTVRFQCGSVNSDGTAHDKRYGKVWVDRNTGIAVRSDMEVHSVYGSSIYRTNDQVVSLAIP